MGWWTLSDSSRWDADTPKPERRQARNDLIGFRTSSRPNHEVKKPREDARREARADRRADRRAASKAEGSSLCASILLASALSAAGLASNIAKLKGWA